ncbi:hypothetical protein IW262DRAFT_1463889 [Armillaria fumosa]|nr:hypothetical protein IW262DRAFT_1463889 [Armillaria fumosa]
MPLLDEYGQSPSECAHYYALRLISLSLSNKSFDGPPVVLSPPDFDSQNIMADPHTFTVTGFIHWDDVDWDPTFMVGLRGHSRTKRIPTKNNLWRERLPKDDGLAQNDFSCEEPSEVLQVHQDFYYAIYADVDPILLAQKLPVIHTFSRPLSSRSDIKSY